MKISVSYSIKHYSCVFNSDLLFILYFSQSEQFMLNLF